MVVIVFSKFHIDNYYGLLLMHELTIILLFVHCIVVELNSVSSGPAACVSVCRSACTELYQAASQCK